MYDDRTNKAFAFVGGIGSGKTVRVQNIAFLAAYRNKISAIMQKENISKIAARNLLLSSFKTKEDWISNMDYPILIVDDEDHPAYRNYTRITPRQIEFIDGKPGFYRCFSTDTKSIQNAIREKARNMVLVLEDATKYYDGDLTEDQKKTIVNRKQRNVDMLLLFHGFSFVPPKIYRLINGIYVMRMEEDPSYSKSKITCYGLVKEAYDKVVKSTADFPCEYIKLN